MDPNLEQLISRFSLDRILVLLLGLIVIFFLRRLLKKVLGRYVKESNSWYRTKKVVNIFGYILVVIFILIIYSDRIQGIGVFLGIAGAGLAFTLQEIILSVAGWISIMVGDIYKTGDRVAIGESRGDVIDFGVINTTIMEIGEWVDGDLYSGRIVKISNSSVFKGPVYNYSANFPFLWDEIKIPIKYGSNYIEARKIIKGSGERIVGDYAAQADKHWDIMLRKFLIENATTAPMVTLEANDNWMEYTLRYVVDYKKRRLTKDMLFEDIIESIEMSNYNIELASATFDIVGFPRVEVKK